MQLANDPSQWNKVKSAPTISKGSDPEGPLGLVSETGRMTLNRKGTVLLETIALEQGLENDKYHIEFHVNPEAGIALATPVEHGTLDSMPVRREKKCLVLYLKGVFNEYPHIKASGRRLCMVGEAVDPNGKRCLKITLKSSLLPKQRRTRTAATTPATVGE